MISDKLIKGQELILNFLMEGVKGRLDFWNNQDFAHNKKIDRGVYPKGNLHMLLDAGIVEKFTVKNRIRWKLVNGAFFRMSDGREITWHDKEPEVVNTEPMIMFLDGERKPITLEEVKVEPIELGDSELMDTIVEVENEYDYLDKAKEIMDTPKKKKKWRIKWRS